MTDAHADFERDDRKTAGDPAQAFEELRQAVEKLSREIGGEMTVIRKGVEAAFDQVDRIGHTMPGLRKLVPARGVVFERHSQIIRRGECKIPGSHIRTR